MARGEPIKQVEIGFRILGKRNGTTHCYYLAKSEKKSPQQLANDEGLSDVRIMSIFKD